MICKSYPVTIRVLLAPFKEGHVTFNTSVTALFMVYMWRYSKHVDMFINVMLLLPQSIQPHCGIVFCLCICVVKAAIFSFNDVIPAKLCAQICFVKIEREHVGTVFSRLSWCLTPFISRDISLPVAAYAVYIQSALMSFCFGRQWTAGEIKANTVHKALLFFLFQRPVSVWIYQITLLGSLVSIRYLEQFYSTCLKGKVFYYFTNLMHLTALQT